MDRLAFRLRPAKPSDGHLEINLRLAFVERPAMVFYRRDFAAT